MLPRNYPSVCCHRRKDDTVVRWSDWSTVANRWRDGRRNSGAIPVPVVAHQPRSSIFNDPSATPPCRPCSRVGLGQRSSVKLRHSPPGPKSTLATAQLRNYGRTNRLVRERQHLHVSTIEPATELRYNEYTHSIRRLDVLLAERGNLSLADAGVDLLFDGATLTMSSGQSWPAVSGRPVNGAFDYSPSRQRVEDVGPIPAGIYYVDPTQLVSLSERWFYSLRYEHAWGTHRITIHPFESTVTFGRGGFFIHGGATAGSAGCIDLTSNMSSFASRLGVLPPGTKVKLTVRYPPAP